MENASKALIIAGAILLSILIIGLGMMIYQQATSAVEDTGLDAQKIQTYNSDFTSYIGENIKGTDVRSLFEVVKNHNLAEDDKTTDNPRIVTLNGKIDAAELDTEKRAIKTGARYDVSATYNDEGLISTITATQK